jgi:hypothetical protein
MIASTSTAFAEHLLLPSIPPHGSTTALLTCCLDWVPRAVLCSRVAELCLQKPVPTPPRSGSRQKTRQPVRMAHRAARCGMTMAEGWPLVLPPEQHPFPPSSSTPKCSVALPPPSLKQRTAARPFSCRSCHPTTFTHDAGRHAGLTRSGPTRRRPRNGVAGNTPPAASRLRLVLLLAPPSVNGRHPRGLPGPAQDQALHIRLREPAAGLCRVSARATLCSAATIATRNTQ